MAFCQSPGVIIDGKIAHAGGVLQMQKQYFLGLNQNATLLMTLAINKKYNKSFHLSAYTSAKFRY